MPETIFDKIIAKNIRPVERVITLKNKLVIPKS